MIHFFTLSFSSPAAITSAIMAVKSKIPENIKQEYKIPKNTERNKNKKFQKIAKIVCSSIILPKFNIKQKLSPVRNI